MGNFVYCIFIFTGFYANMGNYVYCIVHIYRILPEHWKLCLLYNSHFQDSTRIWETLYCIFIFTGFFANMGNYVYCIFIFTGFYANMGNYVYCTIHIYSILRGHGKLCLLYNSHFKDSTRIWETMYIVYSYFQDSTRIWETTKGLEIVSLSLGWKRISSNSWLNVQLRHNLTGL